MSTMTASGTDKPAIVRTPRKFGATPSPAEPVPDVGGIGEAVKKLLDAAQHTAEEIVRDAERARGDIIDELGRAAEAFDGMRRALDDVVAQLRTGTRRSDVVEPSVVEPPVVEPPVVEPPVVEPPVAAETAPEIVESAPAPGKVRAQDLIWDDLG
jgi:hypothetical protein